MKSAGEIVAPNNVTLRNGEKWKAFSASLKDFCFEKRGEAVWKELRAAPCQGCGSPFHGYLAQDGATGKHTYNCPCMDIDAGHKVEWYEERRARFQLCPLRLAKECRYDEQMTCRALKRHTDRGAGRFMKQEAL